MCYTCTRIDQYLYCFPIRLTIARLLRIQHVRSYCTSSLVHLSSASKILVSCSRVKYLANLGPLCLVPQLSLRRYDRSFVILIATWKTYIEPERRFHDSVICEPWRFSKIRDFVWLSSLTQFHVSSKPFLGCSLLVSQKLLSLVLYDCGFIIWNFLHRFFILNRYFRICWLQYFI